MQLTLVESPELIYLFRVWQLMLIVFIAKYELSDPLIELIKSDSELFNVAECLPQQFVMSFLGALLALFPVNSLKDVLQACFFMAYVRVNLGDLGFKIAFLIH